jgi:hypothetical protein
VEVTLSKKTVVYEFENMYLFVLVKLLMTFRIIYCHNQFKNKYYLILFKQTPNYYIQSSIIIKFLRESYKIWELFKTYLSIEVTLKQWDALMSRKMLQ